MEKELLKIAEAAEILGISRSTLYEIIGSKNAIRTIRIGRSVRIPTGELKRWIASETEKQWAIDSKQDKPV